MKRLILIACLVIWAIPNVAQEVTDRKAVQVQLDVLGFAQSGFGIVGGYLYGQNRVDFDLLTNTLFDSFINGSQDFKDFVSERRSVMSINYYRYLNKEQVGFYYGGGLSYYEYIIEHNDLNETQTKNAYKPGFYIGYDFLPFKNSGFYIDIWLGGRWHWEGEEQLPFSNGQYYKIPNLDAPLGMIKFGWRFDR